MAGKLVYILPPTTLDFAQLAGGAGNSISIPLAQRIDVSGYESGLLQVRTHSRSFANGTDSLQIIAAPHGFTSDDPSRDFGAAQPSPTTVTINAAAASIDFVHPSLSIVSGLYQVIAKAARGGAATGALQARVSIELLLRTGASASAPAARTCGVFMGYR